jgi:hypothetical protein
VFEQLSPVVAAGAIVLTLYVALVPAVDGYVEEAMALPTTNRSMALSCEGNGGDGIGESVVMAAAYGRTGLPVSWMRCCRAGLRCAGHYGTLDRPASSPER